MKLRMLREAAQELGVPNGKIRNGVLDGRYPSIRVGRYWMVDVDQLRSILEGEKDTKPVRISECAERIGIKVSTLRNMMDKGVVPFERRGKFNWFVVEDVKAALEKQIKSDMK